MVVDTDRYWETYDGQQSSEFTQLMYTNLNGEVITEETKDDLAMQVRNIRRRNGKNTEVILLQA